MFRFKLKLYLLYDEGKHCFQDKVQYDDYNEGKEYLICSGSYKVCGLCKVSYCDISYNGCFLQKCDNIIVVYGHEVSCRLRKNDLEEALVVAVAKSS